MRTVDDYLNKLKEGSGKDGIIATQVKHRRWDELGLSQDKLLEKISMSKGTLVKIEHGHEPKMDQIYELCRGLDCDPGYLLGMHEDPHEIGADIKREIGLTEETLFLLLGKIETIEKKKWGRKEAELELAFINYFIPEIGRLIDLLKDSIRIKYLEEELKKDKDEAEIREAYKRITHRDVGENVSYPLAHRSDSKYASSKNMLRALTHILEDKYPDLDESELTNIAGTAVRKYFTMLDETDKRVNDFALSDTFLQVVRDFAKDYTEKLQNNEVAGWWER